VRDVLLPGTGGGGTVFSASRNGAPTPDTGAVSAWETFARIPRPFDTVVLAWATMATRPRSSPARPIFRAL